MAIVYFLAHLIKAGRPLIPLIGGGVLLVISVVLAIAQVEGWALAQLIPFESRW